MAIIKNAKNITIAVKGKYSLNVGGKFENIAEKINIEATNGNIVLASNKKIIATDNVK